MTMSLTTLIEKLSVGGDKVPIFEYSLNYLGNFLILLL